MGSSCAYSTHWKNRYINIQLEKDKNLDEVLRDLKIDSTKAIVYKSRDFGDVTIPDENTLIQESRSRIYKKITESNPKFECGTYLMITEGICQAGTNNGPQFTDGNAVTVAASGSDGALSEKGEPPTATHARAETPEELKDSITKVEQKPQNFVKYSKDGRRYKKCQLTMDSRRLEDILLDILFDQDPQDTSDILKHAIVYQSPATNDVIVHDEDPDTAENPYIEEKKTYERIKNPEENPNIPLHTTLMIYAPLEKSTTPNPEKNMKPGPDVAKSTTPNPEKNMKPGPDVARHASSSEVASTQPQAAYSQVSVTPRRRKNTYLEFVNDDIDEKDLEDIPGLSTVYSQRIKKEYNFTKAKELLTKYEQQNNEEGFFNDLVKICKPYPEHLNKRHIRRCVNALKEYCKIHSKETQDNYVE